MINAKDINSRRFEKAAFGYKQEDVDEYLKELSLEVAQLQKEKDDCEKKIDVLADKIRDYMKDEDALKEALLGAQRQGHQVIDEAKTNAAKILAEANEKSDEILSDTKAQLEREKKILKNTKKEVADFRESLLSAYKEHIGLITDLPHKIDEEEAAAQYVVETEEIIVEEVEETAQAAQ